MLADRRIVTGSIVAWIDNIGWFALEKGDEIEIRSFRGNKVHCYFKDMLATVDSNQLISNTTPKKIITLEESEEAKKFRRLHIGEYE